MDENERARDAARRLTGPALTVNQERAVKKLEEAQTLLAEAHGLFVCSSGHQQSFWQAAESTKHASINVGNILHQLLDGPR